MPEASVNESQPCLTVKTIRARNLISYKPIHEEKEESKKKAAKNNRHTEDDEKSPLWSLEPPNTHVLVKDLNGKVIESAAVKGHEVDYEQEIVQVLSKSPRFLNMLHSGGYEIEVVEKEGSELFASYHAWIPFARILEGDICIEGWFPLELVTITAMEKEKWSRPPTTHMAESGSKPHQASTPEIFISILLSAPLLSLEQIQEATIVTVCVDALQGVPSDWLIDFDKLVERKRAQGVDGAKSKTQRKNSLSKAQGKPGKGGAGRRVDSSGDLNYEFTLSLDIPVSATEALHIEHFVSTLDVPNLTDKEELEFVISTEDDKEISKKDKASKLPKEEKDRLARELKEKEEARSQALARRMARRYVPWSFNRQIYLTRAGLKALHEHIKGAQPLVVAVSRHVWRESEDDGGNAIKEAGPVGLATIDLHTLLYEGETDVQATSHVSMTAETVTQLAEERERQRKAREEELKRTKKSEVPEEEDVGCPDFFTEAKTSISLSMHLSKPIFSVSTTPRVMPKDLIPSRKPALDPEPTAEQEFALEITNALALIAEAFVSTDKPQVWDEQAVKAHQKELMYKLNSSGTYYRLKEQLKPAVARIFHLIKSPFISSDNGLNSDVMSREISQLHAFLLEQMTITLNWTITAANKSSIMVHEATEPFAPKITDLGDFGPAQLKVLAVESELNGLFSVAADYHERRVRLPEDGSDVDIFVQYTTSWRPRESAHHWYEYAAFCMRTEEQREAERCLREAISINDHHVPSLVAYAMLMLEKDDLEAAEVFVRASVSLQPSNYLIKCLEALYLEVRQEKALSMQSYTKAAELYVGYMEKQTRDYTGDERSEVIQQTLKIFLSSSCFADYDPTMFSEPTQFLLQAARYILFTGCPTLAQKLIAKQENLGLKQGRFWLIITKGMLFHKQGDIRNAVGHLRSAGTMGQDQGEVISAFALLGHVLFQNKQPEEAFKAYNTWLEWEPVRLDRLLLLRQGTMLLLLSQWEAALAVCLLLCQNFPCCTSFLNTARCYLGMDRLEEAERALSQANRLNPGNAEVWGWLVVVMLRSDKYEKAKSCFKWACNLALEDAEIFKTLGNLFLTKGLLDMASQALTRSLEYNNQDAMCYVLLGDVAQGMHNAEGQLLQYQQALILCGSGKLKTEVEDRIAMCKKCLQIQ